MTINPGEHPSFREGCGYAFQGGCPTSHIRYITEMHVWIAAQPTGEKRQMHIVAGHAEQVGDLPLPSTPLTSASTITSSLDLTPLPLYYKDLCDDTGPAQKILGTLYINTLFLKILF